MNDDTPIRAALAELVRLKDLKESCEVRYGLSPKQAVHAMHEYNDGKEAAWEAARLALAATEPAEPPFAWPFVTDHARSWNGFNVCGDKASIDEVGRLAHYEPQLRAMVAEQSRSASSLTESAAREPGVPAHSKSEYKRRVALGDPTVLPPVAVPRTNHRWQPCTNCGVCLNTVTGEATFFHAHGCPNNPDEQSRSASSLTESAAREPKRYVSDEESKGEYAKESLIPLAPAATEIRAAPSEPLTEEQLQVLADHPVFGRIPTDSHWFPLSRSDTNKPTIFAKAVAEIRWLRAEVAKAAPDYSGMVWRACVHASLPWDARQRVVDDFDKMLAALRASTPSPSPTGEKP